MKKKAKKLDLIKRPNTFKQMLSLIDQFLAKDNAASEHLWDVLSALRGPDDGMNILKASTTVHVRRRAFPRTAERDEERGVSIGATFVTSRPFDPSIANGHFATHIASAAKVLGLVE